MLLCLLSIGTAVWIAIVVSSEKNLEGSLIVADWFVAVVAMVTAVIFGLLAWIDFTGQNVPDEPLMSTAVKI